VVAHITTVAFNGIEVLEVDIQVQISGGMPAFTVVGLPDKAVAESRERVRAALNALGLSLPPKRITVNLSPANLVKEGSHFDLPIALGLLAAMGVVPADDMATYCVLGELTLDAGIRPVNGVLPAAITASARSLGPISSAISWNWITPRPAGRCPYPRPISASNCPGRGPGWWNLPAEAAGW